MVDKHLLEAKVEHTKILIRQIDKMVITLPHHISQYGKDILNFHYSHLDIDDILNEFRLNMLGRYQQEEIPKPLLKYFAWDMMDKYYKIEAKRQNG